MKIIAFYLPQFHAIKENDEWWGEGFTEWTNVRTAVPTYKGQYMPRVPLNNNYYSLLDVETLKWQAKIAKEYGIYGALDTLEEELPKQFRRCHRSYIINTSYISKVWYSKNSILLKNDEEMPLSRSYKTIIKEVVNSEN